MRVACCGLRSQITTALTKIVETAQAWARQGIRDEGLHHYPTFFVQQLCVHAVWSRGTSSLPGSFTPLLTVCYAVLLVFLAHVLSRSAHTPPIFSRNADPDLKKAVEGLTGLTADSDSRRRAREAILRAMFAVSDPRCMGVVRRQRVT